MFQFSHTKRKDSHHIQSHCFNFFLTGESLFQFYRTETKAGIVVIIYDEYIHVPGTEYLDIPIFLAYDQKEVKVGKEI